MGCSKPMWVECPMMNRTAPPSSSEEVNPWCYPGCILIDRAKKEAPAQASENAEQTDNILSVLKRRYKGEMAILDYVEMIECEVLSLRTGGEPR